jgi:hypothetical protein
MLRPAVRGYGVTSVGQVARGGEIVRSAVRAARFTKVVPTAAVEATRAVSVSVADPFTGSVPSFHVTVLRPES